MPRADEYAGAAAWCEEAADVARRLNENAIADVAAGVCDVFTDYPEEIKSATLAARCVRAWAAWFGRTVDLWRGKGDESWLAVRLGADGEWIGPVHKAADPLDAITAALGGDDATA